MAMDNLPLMKEQTIELTGLRVSGTHGVLPEEQSQTQDFLVDVRMQVCAQAALADDDIGSTISYADVADAVVEIIRGPHVNLIETLADRIAQKIVTMGARMVTVTVHKPQAPIPHSFADVSAKASLPGTLFEQKSRRIVIALGSNLDVPEAHIIDAVGSLREMVEIEAVSELYRTAPQLAEGQEEQPDYVNAVVICRTDTPLLPFLHLLHHIEAEHGRVRTKRWEARTLDIDVIDVEGVSSSDPELLLPHPRAAVRRFVLEPWLSIDPTAKIGEVLVSDILEQVKDQPIERMNVDEYMPRVMQAMERWDQEDELDFMLGDEDMLDEEIADYLRENGRGRFGEGFPLDMNGIHADFNDIDNENESYDSGDSPDFWDDDDPQGGQPPHFPRWRL